MLGTIIDHSTLSAVDRLSGHAQVSQGYRADSDIVGLEAFLVANLFYDQVVAVDDYIPEYRNERKARYPYLEWYVPDKSYDLFVQEADRKVESYSHKIRISSGSSEDDKDMGDVAELLSMLASNMVAVWESESTEYRWLEASLRSSLNPEGGPSPIDSRAWSPLVMAMRSIVPSVEIGPTVSSDALGDLVSSANRVEGGMHEVLPDVRQFIAGLHWLAHRTILYSNLAHSWGYDTTLHPIRNAFRARYLGELGLPGETVSKMINDLRRAAFSTTDEIERTWSQDGFITLNVPFFSAYVAHRRIKLRDIGTFVRELREEPEIKVWRSRLRDLEDALAGGRKKAVPELTRIRTALRTEQRTLREAYGLDTPQGWSLHKILTVAASRGSVSIVAWRRIMRAGCNLGDLDRHRRNPPDAEPDRAGMTFNTASYGRLFGGSEGGGFGGSEGGGFGGSEGGGVCRMPDGGVAGRKPSASGIRCPASAATHWACLVVP